MVSPGWADLDRGLFSISVAAELARLHPQTLRIYEREGLLDPARSTGGTRRYSRRDIDRIAEICAYLRAGGAAGPDAQHGRTRRYSRRDIDRIAEICALTADGLNLAGIRRVLALQEETRQLQAELARLRARAGEQP